MTEETFENLTDAIGQVLNDTSEEVDFGPVFSWASDNQYGDMTKADAETIISAAWNFFEKTKNTDYDSRRQYIASALYCVIEWAKDEEIEIDLKLEQNFDDYIQRCLQNDDIVEAMNFAQYVRDNGDIAHYKKAMPLIIDRANSEWGWSDEYNEPGIKQIFCLHDLTKDDANQLLEIAKANSSKRVLKEIMSDYEWRAESQAGEYGSFHTDSSWTISTMLN